ncbi:MAG TPA: hypothetical protein PKD51_10115 [Saprospiraceae bacterium]|nr:hypothetical protein [Saprospiraceae bacterium]HMU05800.1 hypothetical protein [Saprospiraceae bacterium]
MSTIKLGIPTTVGQLRAMISSYPDDMTFGFRNQPRQMLETLDGNMFFDYTKSCATCSSDDGEYVSIVDCYLCPSCNSDLYKSFEYAMNMDRDDYPEI